MRCLSLSLRGSHSCTQRLCGIVWARGVPLRTFMRTIGADAARNRTVTPSLGLLLLSLKWLSLRIPWVFLYFDLS